MTVTIYQGDALAVLRTLAAKSVQCVVTSPPYYGLRSYDENAVRVDPRLPEETRRWLEEELIRRYIRAR
jgi:site-specific DNA-methyltransferase (cytosine-N4-specific)